MASLADVFVAIRGDDRQLKTTLRKDRAELTALDRMSVKPKIVIPDVGPQIQAMQSKLAALSRSKISLGVSGTLAGAEVSTLKRQLDALVAKRRTIPLELADQVDKDIAHVRAELKAAERKQTNIPLKLERVDAKIAAVKGALATLTKPVDVPVVVGKQGLRAQLVAVRAELKNGLTSGSGDVDAAGSALGKRFGGSFSTGVKAVVGGGVILTALNGLRRGFTGAVESAGNFEAQMRLIGVVSGDAGDGLKDLTRLAIDMGAKTAFSAQGASDAMLALAKGGLTSAQIQAGALESTLTLASAGGLELGSAADYMVQGLNAFGLEAKDAAQVAAALAGGANASTASVESMGLALSQVGPGAKTAGLSIQDTTAAIAAFANAGIQGSDAGTSLKTFLTTLVPTTKKARDEMERLGIITAEGGNRLFDATGKVKSLAEVSNILQVALKDQSREQQIATLKTVFGADAYRAAAILATEGATGIEKYTKATNDQSQAQVLAQSAMQGFNGALERARGAAETAAIEFGNKLLPKLTQLMDFMSTTGIPAFAGFAKIVASGVLPVVSTLAKVLGGTLLGNSKSVTFAIGAFLTILASRKITGFADSLIGLSGRLQATGGAAAAAGTKIGALGGFVGKAAGVLGGPWGIAIGLGITALISFAGKQQEAAKQAKAFTDSLTFQNGALDENSRQTLARQLATEGTLAAALKAGIAEKDYTDALINGGAARDNMIKQLRDLAAQHTTTATTEQGTYTVTDKLGKAAQTAADQLQSMGSGLDQSATQAKQAANALGETSKATDASSAAVGTYAKTAELLGTQLTDVKTRTKSLNDELQQSINKFTILKEGALGQEESNNAWQASLDRVKESVKENGKTLDNHTSKGRSNREAVVGMIRSLNDKIVADLKAGVATGELTKRTKKGEDQIRAAARAAGFSKGEIDKMVGSMLKTPKELKTDVEAKNIKKVQAEIVDLKKKIEALKRKILKNEVNFSTNAGALAQKWRVNQANAVSPGLRADGGPIELPKRAAGGPIRGRGGPREDNIAGIDRRSKIQTAWVSAKEFVVNAMAYRKNKRLVEDINSGKVATEAGAHGPTRLADGGLPNSRSWETASSAERAIARRIYKRQWGFQTGDEDELEYSYRNRFREKEKAKRFAREKGSVYKDGPFWYAFAELAAAKAHAQRKVKQSGGDAVPDLSAPIKALAAGGRPTTLSGRPRDLSNKRTSLSGRPGHSAPINVDWNDPNNVNPSKFTNPFSVTVGKKLGKGIGSTLGKSIYKKLKAISDKYQKSLYVGGGGAGPGGSKMSGGIRAIANRFHPSYIAGHRDPQGGPAFDIGSSGSKNRAIRGALAANHARLGLRYVIGQMQIISGKNGWKWRRYSPITGAGDFRHVNHVHVSYDKGGRFRPGTLALNKKGGVERILTERQNVAFEDMVKVLGDRNRELAPTKVAVTGGGNSDAALERLISVIEQRGLNAPTFQFGDIINPREEPLSLTINKALQHTANIGLLG